MRFTDGLICIVLATSGTVLSAAAHQSTSETDHAEWLESQIARELEKPPQPELLNMSERLTVRVPAALQSATRDVAEGTHDAVFSIGTGSPARCFVWEEELDLAGLFQIQTDAIFSAISDLAVRQLNTIDAGAAGGQPFLAVDWLYRVDRDDGSAISTLKLKAARKRGISVFCMHDELGYRETFTSFFEAFMGSLEATVEGLFVDQASYREISRISTSGFNNGVVEYIVNAADGTLEEISHSAILMPGGTQDLSGNDSFEIEYATREGQLISKLAVAAIRSQITAQLNLDLNQDGAWAVSGTAAGEKMERVLGKEELLSTSGQRKTVRQLLGGKGDRNSRFKMWGGTDDPGVIETSIVSISADDKAEATIGGLDFDAQLSASGGFERLDLQHEQVDMVIELVFTEGAHP